MTKLEQKLIELGYYLIQDAGETVAASKTVFVCETDITIRIDENKIVDSWVVSNNRHYPNQTRLNNLQQTFNILQQDLEALKEYEN